MWFIFTAEENVLKLDSGVVVQPCENIFLDIKLYS